MKSGSRRPLSYDWQSSGSAKQYSPCLSQAPLKTGAPSHSGVTNSKLRFRRSAAFPVFRMASPKRCSRRSRGAARGRHVASSEASRDDELPDHVPSRCSTELDRWYEELVPLRLASRQDDQQGAGLMLHPTGCVPRCTSSEVSVIPCSISQRDPDPIPLALRH
jgi:hypothetical protein